MSSAPAQSRSLPPIDVAGLKDMNPYISTAEGFGFGPFVRVGNQMSGPCPDCGKRGKFSISVAKQLGHCFSCGFGGDVINLAQFVKKCGFMDAAKFLRGTKDLTESDRRQLEVARKRREVAAVKAAAAKRARDTAQIAEILSECVDGLGSPVQAYLSGRGVDPAAVKQSPDGESSDGENQRAGGMGWPDDLKFHPGLPAYVGPPGERVEIGKFPAMVAIARDKKRDIKALHRTFLVPTKAGFGKANPLDVDGNPYPNWNAKQMIGPMKLADGGLDLGRFEVGEKDSGQFYHFVSGLSLSAIRGRIHPTDADKHEGWNPPTTDNVLWVIGEGIETTLAVANALWVQRADVPPDTGVLLLADNDFSDLKNLDGSLKVLGGDRAQKEFGSAARRLVRQGHEVYTAWPPVGMDFCDMLGVERCGEKAEGSNE